MLISSKLMSRLGLPLASARNVEEITRSVLAMLDLYTGLESSYFAMIDKENGLVRVRFSYNSKKTLIISEGASAPWTEALCKRSLEDPSFEQNMPDICNEHPGARKLGLKTFASRLVYLANGELYGMLCAISTTAKTLPPASKEALTMFAKVIEQQVQREALFKQVASSMRKASTAAFPSAMLPSERQMATPA